MKKIKVLDLFAGTQSVKKSLDQLDIEYEYIGIDIYTPADIVGGGNRILDLSQDNIIERLKEVIGEFKPDFIWASPLCTTFSRATCIEGGTLSYEIDDNKRVKIRTKFSHITHKAYVKFVNDPNWIKIQQEKGKLGLDLLNNTKEIIDYYNVPFAIENPATALSKYEMIDYVRNVTAYCVYGFPYKKATAIYSNKELELKQCNHKRHDQVMSGWKSKTGIQNAPSSNKDRSAVPPELITQILEQSLRTKIIKQYIKQGEK